MAIGGVAYSNQIKALKVGPLDSKSLAPNFQSLLSEEYWGDLDNGLPYIKNGQLFSTEDGGIYQLLDRENYTNPSSWRNIDSINVDSLAGFGLLNNSDGELEVDTSAFISTKVISAAANLKVDDNKALILPILKGLEYVENEGLNLSIDTAVPFNFTENNKLTFDINALAGVGLSVQTDSDMQMLTLDVDTYSLTTNTGKLSINNAYFKGFAPVSSNPNVIGLMLDGEKLEYNSNNALTLSASFVNSLQSQISNVYKFKGSSSYNLLPLSAVNGDVYNVTDDFTIDEQFYKKGTNVAWVENEDGSGYWDPLGGIVENVSNVWEDVTE